MVGNACVSCFFAADKKKAREEELERVFGLASSYISSLTTNNQQLTTTIDFQSRAALQSAADRLKAGPHPVPCFHWEIEFPEVFSRENGGFDAFVGNPPFLGGLRISTSFGKPYIDWLMIIHEGAQGRGDLAAHFFRRANTFSRFGGTTGLIATNTIAQGDTRPTGIGWLCENNSYIYSAQTRKVWPGLAAVVVSILHLQKGTTPSLCELDGKPVERVSAFLLRRGGNTDPYPLRENDRTARAGVYVLGTGFVFRDEDDGATPIAEMERLIQSNPKNEECIFLFMGGRELNSDPAQETDRFIIDFGDHDEEFVRETWPELMTIVETKVRPQRASQKNPGWAKYWWQYGGSSSELQKMCANVERVLVNAQTSPNLSFAFCSKEMVFGHSVNLFAFDTASAFGILQSRIHEVWARFMGSSMKDDLRYAPSDCFDTFAFPAGWREVSQLEETASDYYAFRTKVMKSNQQGLTGIYNRFHSPDECDAGILELRRLHGEMDVAVLRAYGWDDLADQAAQPDFCQFLLDYEEEGVEGDEWSVESDKPATHHTPPATRSRRRKPYRLRWPDDFRDEVLARLLELNEQRHREELLVGSSQLSVKSKKKNAKKSELVTKRVNDPDQAPQQELF